MVGKDSWTLTWKMDTNSTLWTAFVILLTWILVDADSAVQSAKKTDETRLIETILHKYNSAARPVYNASHSVTVKFGITLTQISDMVSPNHCPWTFCCFFSSLLDAVPSTEKTEPPEDKEISTKSLTESSTSSNFLQQPGRELHQQVRSSDQGKFPPRPVPDEQILMERLLDNYHKYSRPVINASLSVVVKFGLTLVQISDMVSFNWG